MEFSEDSKVSEDSEDSSYLVSGGDDGRVVVWYLNNDYTLDETKEPEGQEIYVNQGDKKKITSIDLKSDKGFVVSGSEDFKVRLHRFKKR